MDLDQVQEYGIIFACLSQHCFQHCPDSVPAEGLLEAQRLHQIQPSEGAWIHTPEQAKGVLALKLVRLQSLYVALAGPVGTQDGQMHRDLMNSLPAASRLCASSRAESRPRREGSVLCQVEGLCVEYRGPFLTLWLLFLKHPFL